MNTGGLKPNVFTSISRSGLIDWMRDTQHARISNNSQLKKNIYTSTHSGSWKCNELVRHCVIDPCNTTVRYVQTVHQCPSSTTRDSRKHNFLISRTNVDWAVRTLTRRTKSLLSGITASKIPLGQWPRLADSSITRTRSPGCKLRGAPNHLWRGRSNGIYSFSHRSQNKSARNCVFLHERR